MGEHAVFSDCRRIGRMEIMLVKLFLQFSALCFCSLERVDKEEKKGKTTFQWATWRLPVCSTWASGSVMHYKKLI
jgi:hypothetical protein